MFLFSPSTQPGWPLPLLLLPVTTWYHQLTVTLSTLWRVASGPAQAADWLLAVSSTLPSSGQQGLCCLSLVVSHVVVTGDQETCQLAVSASEALAAADPSQVRHCGPYMGVCTDIPIVTNTDV